MVEPPYLPESLVPVYFKGGKIRARIGNYNPCPKYHWTSQSSWDKNPPAVLTTMRDHQEEEREEIEALG